MLLALLCALPALLWFYQRKLIYLPLERSIPPAATLLPGVQELSLETADGESLGAWFLPVHDATATVLLMQGNAGNRAQRVPLARALAERRLATLMFDYRGYGDSSGKPSEDGLIADARTALDWLERRDGVDPQRIVYFGESLGAAVAVALAVERPPAALVLRSPFTSMIDMGRLHYPLLPVRWLLVDRWASVDRIEQVHCPLLVVAGGADAIVPVGQSRALFERSPAIVRRFELIEKADHNDLELLAGAQLLEAITSFLTAAEAAG